MLPPPHLSLLSKRSLMSAWVKKLSQGSAGNPSRSLGGAPLRPSSLRTCCLATPHPDVPRLVLEPEVPGLQHPTHLCSQHLHFQPFSLPSCTCASWATCLLTQQVQTFSSGQDAPTTHPPGTPHAPAPGSHLLAQPEQNSSSLLLLFPHAPSPAKSLWN